MRLSLHVSQIMTNKSICIQSRLPRLHQGRGHKNLPPQPPPGEGKVRKYEKRHACGKKINKFAFIFGI